MDKGSGEHSRVCGISKRKQVIFSGWNAGGWGGAFAPGKTGKNVQQRRALNVTLTGLQGLEALE